MLRIIMFLLKSNKSVSEITILVGAKSWARLSNILKNLGEHGHYK